LLKSANKDEEAPKLLALKVGVLGVGSDDTECEIAEVLPTAAKPKTLLGSEATEIVENLLIDAATVSANESSHARSAADRDKSARAERVALACCAVTDANTTSAVPIGICAECGIMGGVENAVASSSARLRTLMRPISW
jgi:hypothetical protein